MALHRAWGVNSDCLCAPQPYPNRYERQTKAKAAPTRAESRRDFPALASVGGKVQEKAATLGG